MTTVPYEPALASTSSMQKEKSVKFTAAPLKILALFVLAIGLSGCASRISSEKLVGQFTTRLKVLTVSYGNTPSLPGQYSTMVEANSSSKNQDWTQHKKQKEKDMPVLLKHIEAGIDKLLVPALVKQDVHVLIDQTDGADGHLRIKPVGFTVECGAGNLICTSKMQIEVILVDYREGRAIWTAKFAVGREFGAEQTEDVAQKFYAQLKDRLVQMGVV